MKKKCIVNGKIVMSQEILVGKAIIFNEKILEIIDESEVDKDIEVIDAKGKYVSPGFIDIHIHGIKGVDTMDGNVEDIIAMKKELTRIGVTSFLPTTMTMSLDKIKLALDNIRSCMETNNVGAKVLGAHLEGPFISKEHKGAQNESFILEPNIKYIEEYLDVIKLITVAPEVDENLEFIKAIGKYKNIALSMGHTSCSYEQAMEAIDVGVKSATHCFNGMTGLHHRKPGAVGAVMNSEIYCELIADTIHIHPAIYDIMGKIKGDDKLILISDAMRATCMKSGIYDLGGQEVQVKDNKAILIKEGTLAGSTLTLNVAVKNIIKNSKFNLISAIKMVTENPAKVIGVNTERGTIEIDKYADFTIFDEDINVIYTIVEGELCYKGE